MYKSFQDLINETPSNWLYYIILIKVLLFIYFALNFNIISTYNAHGYYKDDYLHLAVLLDDASKVNSNKTMSINKSKVKYDIKIISDIKLDEYNFLNYQDYIIALDKKYKNNELLDIKIYYEKEKVYKKLLKKIL